VILHCREAEVDELWSLVGKKVHGQWTWSALDTDTRQILAFHVDERSRQSAHAVWGKLPTRNQKHTTFPTDRYAASKSVIPSGHPVVTDTVAEFFPTVQAASAAK
jgi:IS1 family transposase